jgi:hypothetical protein
MIKQANDYPKWGFIACPGRQAREATNVIVMKRRHPIWQRKHVSSSMSASAAAKAMPLPSAPSLVT